MAKIVRRAIPIGAIDEFIPPPPPDADSHSTNLSLQYSWVSWEKKVIQQFYWLITFFGFNWVQVI